MTLTVGSMCSGVGGLDLGLERAGMRVVWQAENDPHSWRVLARHWPHVPNLGDVTLINWAEVPRVDLIAAGYPCQPFSVAGRRLGQDDPRHLWPDVYAAVRFLRPRWLCLENVAGHLALGFGQVLGDLAEIGYDAEWDCIPAAAVGAHHRRDRVFVVAYPQRDERRPQPVTVSGGGGPAVAGLDGPHRPVADPYGCGRIGRPRALRPAGVTEPAHRGPHLATLARRMARSCAGSHWGSRPVGPTASARQRRSPAGRRAHRPHDRGCPGVIVLRHADTLPYLAVRHHEPTDGRPARVDVYTGPAGHSPKGVTDPRELRAMAWMLLDAARWLTPTAPAPARVDDPQTTLFDLMEASA